VSSKDKNAKFWISNTFEAQAQPAGAATVAYAGEDCCLGLEFAASGQC